MYKLYKVGKIKKVLARDRKIVSVSRFPTPRAPVFSSRTCRLRCGTLSLDCRQSENALLSRIADSSKDCRLRHSWLASDFTGVFAEKVLPALAEK